MNTKDIDIVIPWVDPTDPKWRKEKSNYDINNSLTIDNREIRYRDWGNLKYIFRGIEKFAPWVRKVHFITYGHLPMWMNVNNSKINIVKHSDYIPEEYLPTFSSHVIELNIHRIKDLSEQFIYFNDDIFIIDRLNEEDFFVNGLPCDSLTTTPIIPKQGNFSPILFNTVACINEHFSKRDMIKKNPEKWFNNSYGMSYLIRTLLFLPWKEYVGFATHHLAMPYNKKTLETVWEKEPQLLSETCTHKFRDNRDVNQYIFRYWQLASGAFYPKKIKGKMFTNWDNDKKIVDYIIKKRGKLICINDNTFDCDYEIFRDNINKAFEVILGEKSSFEK